MSTRLTLTVALFGTSLILGIACRSGHALVVRLDAQTLPITRTLAWDAPIADPNTGAVEFYVVRLDGTEVGRPTATTQSVTFTTLGSHTLTVTAENQWGSSAPVSLTVIVRAPGSPRNPRVQ